MRDYLNRKLMVVVPVVDRRLGDRGIELQTLRGRIAKIEAAAGTPCESAATGIPEASDLSLVALCAQDAEGRHATLEEYLGRCVRGVMGLSDVLATRYFTHSADALRHSVGA